MTLDLILILKKNIKKIKANKLIKKLNVLVLKILLLLIITDKRHKDIYCWSYKKKEKS